MSNRMLDEQDVLGPLLSKITCPHCWHVFQPADTLWISEHPDLLGDRLLGPHVPQRFLPNRFTPQGNALDSRGMPTSRLACPHCHLEIPRGIFHLRPVFFSVLGAPASGKSYFLTTMIWRLRKLLPEKFGLALTDLDAIHNQRLQEYENTLFLNRDGQTPVELPKTETTGDLYNVVMLGGAPVQYLKPFLFSIQPVGKHPRAKLGLHGGRALVVYDNAGESFLPGADSARSPVTRHLALSAAWFFVFDPTQDLRFRREVSRISDDPQVRMDLSRPAREVPYRQDVILREAWERVLRHHEGALRKGMPPLVVIVAKADCWGPMLPCWPLPEPYRMTAKGVAGVSIERIVEVSHAVRALMEQHVPEIVVAAETLTRDVVYIPVSSTGCSPETNERGEIVGFLPSKIQPIWVETPLLYTLVRWMPGLVGRLVGSAPRGAAG